MYNHGKRLQTSRSFQYKFIKNEHFIQENKRATVKIKSHFAKCGCCLSSRTSQRITTHLESTEAQASVFTWKEGVDPSFTSQRMAWTFQRNFQRWWNWWAALESEQLERKEGPCFGMKELHVAPSLSTVSKGLFRMKSKHRLFGTSTGTCCNKLPLHFTCCYSSQTNKNLTEL